jgi:hypothetical protein
MNKLGPILRAVGAYGLWLFFIWIGWTGIDHHEDELLRWYVIIGTSAVFLLIYKINEILADGPEALECTFLVYKPTVTGSIGGEDRRQPSIWPLNRQVFLLDRSMPVYAFSCKCQETTKIWWCGRPISDLGTKLPNRDIRSTVAIGGKQDMTRTAQFGCE